jgi:SAM-dependent methyltransferase
MAATRSASEPVSNIEWRRLGKLDVGVSHDYGSGLAEWDSLRDHLFQYGLRFTDVACEIGCGAGRLTNAVAQDFQRVHALDVSEERIAQARTALNAARCVFHRVSEPRIPLPDESCDLVYSVHVFQHFSSLRAVDAYFRDAHRVLRRDGVLMVHLPMIGAHEFTGHLGQLLRYRIGFAARQVYAACSRSITQVGLGRVVEGTGRLLLRLGLPRPAGAGSIYRVFSFVRVSSQLKDIGFERIELRVLPIRGYHSYLFATRP